MSTIRVDNFTPSAGGTAFSISGIAKLELAYNQQTPAVLKSVNVASVTDNSTGNFSVNQTDNSSTANEAVQGTAGDLTASFDVAPTTSVMVMNTFNAAGSFLDSSRADVTRVGELA